MTSLQQLALFSNITSAGFGFSGGLGFSAMGMAVHTCARLLASERDTGGRQQEGLGAGGTVLPSAAYESTMPACVADANSSAIASMLPLHTTDCFTAFCDVFNVVVSGIEAVLLQHDQASFHRTNHLPLQSCTAGCCSLWVGGCTCPPACPSGLSLIHI